MERAGARAFARGLNVSTPAVMLKSVLGDHVHVIRLDAQIVRDLVQWEGRRSLKNRRQGALVLGIEVLDQHESHAGVRGQAREQCSERFESTGRCADPDDGK